MMVMRPTLVGLCLAGCGPPCEPLDRVPIRGASEEGEDHLQTQIRRFSTWLGQPNMCLSEIVVSDVLVSRARPGDPIVGRYNHEHRSLELVEGAANARPVVGATFLHELCHAADSQLPVHSGADPRVPGGLNALDGVAAPRWSPLLRKRELFAETCAQGPDIVDAIRHTATACGADEVAPLAELIAEEVFTTPPESPFAEGAWSARRMGRVPPPAAGYRFRGAALSAAERIGLFFENAEGDSVHLRVNGLTGELLQPPWQEVERDPMRDLVGLDYTTLDGDKYIGVRFHVDFGLVRILKLDPPGFPMYSTLSIQDGGDWRAVDGACGGEGADVAGSVEGIWFFGEADDGGVTWWLIPAPS
jgi:hypothetical protein